MSNSKYYTPKQAAGILGLKVYQLKTLEGKGVLVNVPTNGGHSRYTEESVLRHKAVISGADLRVGGGDENDRILRPLHLAKQIPEEDFNTIKKAISKSAAEPFGGANLLTPPPLEPLETFRNYYPKSKLKAIINQQTTKNEN